MSKIRKYIFGKPLDTGAVVKNIDVTVFSGGNIGGLTVDPDKKTITYVMSEGTVVYGLGETLRGINKRGWLYVSNNADEPHHEEGKHSLYASQNFLLVDNGDGACFGLYIDHPGEVRFDIGYTKSDVLTVSAEDF
ncbi:MAG: alpha-glucosidase, partial [Lachnospiraceae bacterium]|nr:alpha-glucosidase [Lachnospiraceae bacterium]